MRYEGGGFRRAVWARTTGAQRRSRGIDAKQTAAVPSPACHSTAQSVCLTPPSRNTQNIPPPTPPPQHTHLTHTPNTHNATSKNSPRPGVADQLGAELLDAARAQGRDARRLSGAVVVRGGERVCLCVHVCCTCSKAAAAAAAAAAALRFPSQQLLCAARSLPPHAHTHKRTHHPSAAARTHTIKCPPPRVLRPPPHTHARTHAHKHTRAGWASTRSST